jgi:predicted nuclease of predicted toxin-antitoxin system
MKILLDENIPRRLKFDFGDGMEAHTVSEMNCQGKKTENYLACQFLQVLIALSL